MGKQEKGKTKVTLKSMTPKRDYIILSDGTTVRKGVPTDLTNEQVEELSNQSGVRFDTGEQDDSGGEGDGDADSPHVEDSTLHSGDNAPGPGGEVTT